ncbi:MAG: selenide, water dikinase SelD [Planctomycetota bacterium]|nr:selenide, water dikinase SelD [Planctomycetota bacterium]
MMETLKAKRLVLLGIGHTNAYVLRKWSMSHCPDTELVCLSNHSYATYSGMLPAVLAQQRSEHEMQIDLVKLCAAASARLITSPIKTIDPQAQVIRFDDRPSLSYDLLSIGVGSVTAPIGTDSTDPNFVAIKPMQTFLQRLRNQLANMGEMDSEKELKILVVGGGVASVEIALCLPAFLKQHLVNPFKIQLVTSRDRIAPELPAKASGRLFRLINQRSINVVINARVKTSKNNALELESGEQIAGDLVITSTGAAPPDILEKVELPKDPCGFLRIDATLRSTGSKTIFAVGDCGSYLEQPFVKSGVYAVRQGPILWQNLLRSLAGKPLLSFSPQRKFLKLVNLGDGRALAQRGQFTAVGKWAMTWKHRIDDGFISMYQNPQPPMQPGGANHSSGLTHLDDQCRGCGCKLESESLSKGIERTTEDGQVEFQDSVSVHNDGKKELTASVDFFTAPFPDPFLSGRIAALHAISDLVASGSNPIAALSTLVLADGPQSRQQEQFAEITAGINQELSQFSVQIGGGHTIIGPRTEIGLTVMGQRDAESDIGKHRLQDGDHLFLTKPLGIGVLMAAQMRAKCDAKNYETLLSYMLAPSKPLLELLKQIGINAVTDITGFGLAGHLIEMLKSSKKSASVHIESVPIMPGVEALFQQGLQSTLAPGNRKQDRFIHRKHELVDHPKYSALFDPQTCGGLLFGLAQHRIPEMMSAADHLEIPIPTEIGIVGNFCASDDRYLSVL